jgi:hypothetical protein
MLAEAKIKWGFCPPGSVRDSKPHDEGAEGTGMKAIANAEERWKDALKEVIIPGDGIWIKGDLLATSASIDPEYHEAESDEEYVGADSSEDEDEGSEQAQEEEEDEESGSDEEGSPEEDSESETEEVVATGGRFGALSLEE